MAPADVLFSKTTQRLMRVLFSEADAEGLSYAEILRRTGGGSGAIHRELKRFLEAGLLAEKGGSGQRMFVADRSHELYPELHAMAGKLARHGARALDPVLARTLARKYLWWMDPAEALHDQDRLVAQVMNMGTFEDARYVEDRLGDDHLRRILKQARPGHFSERPWTYWHYRLGLSKPGKVPALPGRSFA
ncbi:MAG: hypothetical protein WAO95_10745 [Burkholderiales bacterium]